jgi:hypothetical protein
MPRMKSMSPASVRTLLLCGIFFALAGCSGETKSATPTSSLPSKTSTPGQHPSANTTVFASTQTTAPIPSETDPPEVTGGDLDAAGVRGPDFDNPTNGWPNKKSLPSVTDAAQFLKFRPITGKFLALGEDPLVTVGNGELMLHYAKTRVFLDQASGSPMSEAIARSVVAAMGPGATKSGTRMEVIDLGSGFFGILTVGPGSANVQFGTDDMYAFAVAPSDTNGLGRGRVIAMARAAVKELAETTKPSVAPADPADPPTSAAPSPTQPTAPPTTADQHPATGIYPRP